VTIRFDNRYMSFPIGSLLKPSLYSNGFEDICIQVYVGHDDIDFLNMFLLNTNGY